MNRVLFLMAVLAASAVSRVEAAADAYTNNTTVEVGGQVNIAATNILNNGQFFASGLSSDYFFYDALNYTNRNLMSSSYGFTFDRTPSGSGAIRMANNFVNTNQTAFSSPRIYGGVDVNISATNIINRGIIEAGLDKIKLDGRKIDLSNGTLRITDATNFFFFNFNLSRLFDQYWGISTNMSFFLSASNNSVVYANSDTPVAVLNNGVYLSNNFSQISLTNPAAYVYTNVVNPTNIFKTVVLINNSNPAVALDVRFLTGSSFATPILQWSNVVANPGAASSTNLLYLTDNLGVSSGPRLVTHFPNNFTFNQNTTFAPANYTFSQTAPLFVVVSNFVFLTNNFSLISPSNAAFSPNIFGSPFPFASFGFFNGESTAYGVQMSPLTFDPSTMSLGTSLLNQPGRIEVRANDITMNHSRIEALNYLVLKATNNFIGSSNAFVTVPYSDISLSSTNGLLSITNLLSSYVPRLVGTISLWSGRWTNVDANDVTNYYHVLMVDSRLDPKFPSKVNNITLNATNIFLSDVLNVQSNFYMTAERLTITTNVIAGVGGELNIQSSSITLADGFPNLRYFTNYGRLSSWNNTVFGNPLVLQAFVNRGEIDSEGNSINATIFENTGSILTRNAAFYLQSVYAGLTNSLINALSGDIFLQSSNLTVQGSTLRSGRKLSVDVSGQLTDGGVLSYWECNDGFDFPTRPLFGDLFFTTVTNIAFDNAQTISSSAVADRGASPASFTNSATIGRLVLDGGPNSGFIFTGNSTSNAIYIDYLELKNNATNAGALLIDDNITLYVAASGPLSPEKLSLIYPRLVWASTYLGANSSTNITLRNGQTITVNSALPGATSLDSDGDGVPNSIDPYPFDGLQATGTTNVALQTVAISWFADSASWQYYIDYSTDLITWTPLTTLSSGPVAGQLMTYQESLSVGDRFYRVRTLSH